jgi:hypothetical protein
LMIMAQSTRLAAISTWQYLWSQFLKLLASIG